MKTSLIHPEVQKSSLDAVAADVLVLPTYSGLSFLPVTDSADKKLNGALSAQAKKLNFDGEKGKSIFIDLQKSGFKAMRFLLVGLGPKKEVTRVSVRDAYGSASMEVSGAKAETVALAESLEGAVEGFLLGMYRFNKYKEKPEKPQSIKKVILVGFDAKGAQKAFDGLTKLLTYLEATYLARDLVNEPANIVTPTFMEKLSSSVAKEGGLTFKVLQEAELKKRGMNLILAVGMGSMERPRMVHLEYVPKNKASKSVALIGKGVCFDSGGLSLKPQDYMYGMKADMAGAAAVLCTMWAVAKLKPSVHVHGVFPLVENIPSHESVKPGDVFVGHSGKSVEIENTDAEGRLILADALSYVKDLKVDEAIDCATLTGAVVVALGEDIAGVFTANDSLRDRIIEAGDRAGEQIWSLPLEKSYLKLLKSDVADLKNTAGRYGGAITAALFLAEFAPPHPWAHVDIAGPAHVSYDWPTCIKGGTGFLVRTFLEYLGAK